MPVGLVGQGPVSARSWRPPGSIALVIVLVSLASPALAQRAKKSDETATPAARVDLNTATQKELENLPGIGPASAKKIIANRPYASPAELVKAGISRKTIDKIAGLVTASGTQPLAPRAAKPSEPAPPAVPRPAP